MPTKDRRFLLTALSTALFLTGCAAPQAPPRLLWPPPPESPRIEWIGTYASQNDFSKSPMQRRLEALTGEQEPTGFKTPFGVASDGKGLVYVSDVHDANVRVYDLNAKTVNYLLKITQFDTPLGLAVDSAGNLYVADGGKQQVLVFSPQRIPLFAFGGPELFEKPAYLALNERLGRIYVSDSKGHKIVVFDLKGNHLFSFGERGGADGRFYGPQGLAIDQENRVFVADLFNARIQSFDADGTFLTKFGERGDQVYQFENPKDLAFDSEGNLWIVDGRKASILTYTPEGKLLLMTGVGASTTHKLGFSTPTGIWIDANDRLYVADGLNRRFAIWQYLSEDYLERHPITEEDKARLQQFLDEEKKRLEKEQGKGS